MVDLWEDWAKRFPIISLEAVSYTHLLEALDPARIGVMIGSGIGGVTSFRENIDVVQAKGCLLYTSRCV